MSQTSTCRPRTARTTSSAVLAASILLDSFHIAAQDATPTPPPASTRHRGARCAWSMGPTLGKGQSPSPSRQQKTGWRRFVGPRGSDAIELIGTTRLTPRHSVHVVQWEGRNLLIGCSDQTIALLAESTPKPGAGTGPLADASMPADRSGDA